MVEVVIIIACSVIGFVALLLWANDGNVKNCN
jgi:hypothetical protein